MVSVRHYGVGDEVPRGEHSFGGWRSACVQQRDERWQRSDKSAPTTAVSNEPSGTDRHRPPPRPPPSRWAGQGMAGLHVPLSDHGGDLPVPVIVPPRPIHASPPQPRPASSLVRQPTTSDGPRGRSLSADLCTIGRYRRTNIPTNRQTQRNADRDTSLLSCIGEV